MRRQRFDRRTFEHVRVVREAQAARPIGLRTQRERQTDPRGPRTGSLEGQAAACGRRQIAAIEDDVEERMARTFARVSLGVHEALEGSIGMREHVQRRIAYVRHSLGKGVFGCDPHAQRKGVGTGRQRIDEFITPSAERRSDDQIGSGRRTSEQDHECREQRHKRRGIRVCAKRRQLRENVGVQRGFNRSAGAARHRELRAVRR